MAKILFALLLIVNAVAGDEINELCTQLIGQFNLLQSLVPLEVDVFFSNDNHYQGFITGHAKYRFASELTLPDNGCVVTGNKDNYKQVVIRSNSYKAYIISPYKIMQLYHTELTLRVDVEQMESAKKVSVTDLSFSNKQTFDEVAEVTPRYMSYISKNIEKSLKENLIQMLSFTFSSDERVSISSSLVKALMQNVYLANAQLL
nr:uncharacterized protein LOC106691511 [Halyomorpha halys]